MNAKTHGRPQAGHQGYGAPPATAEREGEVGAPSPPGYAAVAIEPSTLPALGLTVATVEERPLLTVAGAPVERQGWKDTVNVPKSSTVRFAVQYEPLGMWMYHCHILEHARSTRRQPSRLLAAAIAEPISSVGLSRYPRGR